MNMNSTIRQIFRHLLGGMLSGKFHPGMLLPTEAELAVQFQTTRMNVFRALELLKRHGLIERRKKAGSCIADPVLPERIHMLLNESSRTVYVLHSASPRRIHWNEFTFHVMEKKLTKADYSVRYLEIPPNGNLAAFRSQLSGIESEGASALILFPDTADRDLIHASSQFLMESGVPVLLLHRTDSLGRLDFASSVVIDHFSDGIQLGRRFLRNNVRSVVVLNGDISFSTNWMKLRIDGLKTGLSGTGGEKFPVRFLNGTTEAFSETLRMIREDARSGNLFFVAINDGQSIPFLDYWNSHGLKDGKDFHLTAFDGNPDFASRNLTTMRVPHEKIGSIFAGMVCEKFWLSDPTIHLSVRVESEFVQGSTCRILK